MPYTAEQVASHLQAKLVGEPSTLLTGFAPADRAKAGDLTFAESPEYFTAAAASAASAIIVSGSFEAAGKVLIQVTNARIAFARVLELFFPEIRPPAGVHPSAVIAAGAQVDASAHIGPCCVIGKDARIGARTVLHGGNHVGEGCKLGDDVMLFPNVTLYPRSEIGHRVRIHAGSVVGSDGYGYVLDGGVHRKVPQIGNVIIGDDVEIGANVTIDRGALGPTVVGKGTKIDNLVQIAHNVKIGEHCLVVAQAAIAGSTRLGNYVVLAGQVGLAGHLKIGNQVTVAAQSGVMHDIPDGEKWFGTPAMPDKQMKRQIIALRHLHELAARVKELENKLQG